MNVIVRQTCRLCGSPSLTPILDLGSQMLATAFSSPQNKDLIPTRKVPLELVRCNPEIDEHACGLVQLRHSFPPDAMYTDYWYASGVNQTMRDGLADVAEKAKEFVTIEEGDIAFDIGCNDGTLLLAYSEPELTLVGLDPAKNFLENRGEGFIRITDYFSKGAYTKVMGEKKAKIITSIAMFYDLEDPIAITKEIYDILDDDGIWIVQLADLPEMLSRNMFDNICHEHLEYYHMAPFEYLLNKCDMKLVDMEKNAINGSSYRFYIRKKKAEGPTPEATRRLVAERIKEFNLELDTDKPWQVFKQNIEKIKKDILTLIQKATQERKKVFVYGASTKGNVLLQYCGITSDMVPYAADRNPRKVGTTTLGTDIPIISEEDARAMNPNYFLVLPYHFLPEMLEREQEFIGRGGKFIVPVPHVHLAP